MITTLKYTVWFTTLNSTSSALPCTTWQGHIEHVGSSETHICAQSYCEICRSEIIIMWLRNTSQWERSSSTRDSRNFSYICHSEMLIRSFVPLPVPVLYIFIHFVTIFRYSGHGCLDVYQYLLLSFVHFCNYMFIVTRAYVYLWYFTYFIVLFSQLLIYTVYIYLLRKLLGWKSSKLCRFYD